MEVDISLKSDQLNKEDLRALLQAIRDCEMATFPNKEISIWVEVPDFTSAECTEILMSIKPPFNHGPVNYPRLKP
uniref:Uncharacterized protein n=1 Tax=viral metagenome TaxID=1070528 RepID=A0A6M3X6B3_9ZZZZ